MMNIRSLKCKVPIVILMAYLTCIDLAMATDLFVELSAGGTYSSDFHDLVESVYGEQEHANGMLMLGASVGRTMAQGVDVKLGIDVMYAAVLDGNEDRIRTTVVVPKLGVNWTLLIDSPYFLTFDILRVIPNSEIKDVSVESDGIGYGLYIGYLGGYRTGFQVGLQHIPIRTGSQSDGIDDMDFGGFSIRLFTGFD